MPAKHSQLYPWYVGIAIIVVFEIVFGYLFLGPSSPCMASSPVPQVLFTLLLVALPVVYLVLMYLALKSQP